MKYMILTYASQQHYDAMAGRATDKPAWSAEDVAAMGALAIRLARLLHRLLPAEGEVAGLLALMLLTDARRPARAGPQGELIPMAEQDRNLWNADFIAEGVALKDARRQTVARQYATFDEYISSCPADVQSILEQVRRTVRKAAPAAGEAISYAMPTITLGGRDLVSFAAWKHHIGLYPLPARDDAFAQELAPYRAAKSAVRFPLSKPIPHDLIARLVVLHVKQRLDRGT